MSSDTKTAFKHIRFLGSEGIGMSALIRILEQRRNLGTINADLKISRSDLSFNQNDPLDSDIDLVVRSTAIAESDPDYAELRSRGLPIWHRSDMLNYVSEGYKQIVLTGTHGKTTCTAMLSYILVEAGLDPGFAVGGMLINYDSNGRAGKGEYFVLEGDESDKSYTKTNPYLALLTYMEPDHLENYPGGFAEIKKCFLDFVDRAEHAVLCIDDPNIKKYWSEKKSTKKDLLSYSAVNTGADFVLDAAAKTFKFQGNSYKLELALAGTHNLINAVGCIAAAFKLGVPIEKSVEILRGFKGIRRRFELINDRYNGAIRVYDDYAHHPTEVKAVLQGALSMNPKRLVFVYQPHHPERTKQLWNDFIEVFKDFPDGHLCLLADIYVARSKHIEGVNSERLVQEINNPNVRYLKPLEVGFTSQGNFADMVAALKPSIDEELEGCDYLFLVGAGNIDKVAKAFK